MNPNKEKLIGELIGIARATDGNEHLITDESTAFIRVCLAAEPGCEDEFALLLNRCAQIKRGMVPDCYCCANPCGRTAAFDLTELNALESHIRDRKLYLLNCLINLSKSGRGEDALFYRGLIVLGMEDYPEEALHLILQEAEDAQMV